MTATVQSPERLDAAIIQDELGDRGAAVGTPAHLGGVAYDRLGVTGYGVAEAADAELWGVRGKQDPVPLKPGDTVTLTVEGIGSVSNTVVAGPDPLRGPCTMSDLIGRS